MGNAFTIVRDFERGVEAYTGAPFAVAVNSCSMALFLALMWRKERDALPPLVEIPKHTYVSVPMAVMHAGSRPVFVDKFWRGVYELGSLKVWDAAKRFTSGMFHNSPEIVGLGNIICTSHHWNKILGVEQGGMILHDSPAADKWFRRARFDGRSEGVPPKSDVFDQLGWHCYMSPETAAAGLVRLSFLPKVNADMPMDDYPDLSKGPIFFPKGPML